MRPRIHSVDRRAGDPRASEHRELLRGGIAVCVRLCDGSFFPSNTDSGGDAACNAQCPDAPTALYVKRPDSGGIEDAVSMSGTLYSDLPVAGRYRTVLDSTCVCHRHRVSYSAMLLHDRTLRKGDAVMTPKGVVVYEGANTSFARAEDFVALAQESRLPVSVGEYLSKMQSSPRIDGQLVSQSVAASTPIDPPGARRGSIWIDIPSALSR
jgi:hypothetical protein